MAVDFHYSRIAIAEHELTADHLTIWLEDKQDYKNTLDECLQLSLPLRSFAKFIRQEGFNSYETLVMHPDKKFVYPALLEISKPLTWYRHDATAFERQCVREALVKALLTQLIENEVAHYYDYAI